MRVFLKLLVAILLLLPAQTIAAPKCIVGGCSGELCVNTESDATIMSTCLWQEGYECYKQAKCEKQKNSECGWTETREYKTCIGKSGKQYPAPKGRDRWK